MNSKLDVTVAVDLSELAAADPEAVQLLTTAGPPEARLLGPNTLHTMQAPPGIHPRPRIRRTAPPMGAPA